MDAEQIVQALATKPAPIDSGYDGCHLCLAQFTPHSEAAEDPQLHKPNCIWRLAREWVSAAATVS